MDHVSYQTAYGGPIAGGDLATTILPPLIPGYQKFDLFPTPDNKGDVTKAKDELSSAASRTASRPTSPTGPSVRRRRRRPRPSSRLWPRSASR